MLCDQLRPTKTQRVTGYAPKLGKGIGQKKASRRDVKHQKLHTMYTAYFTQTGGNPVLQAVLPPPPLPPKSTLRQKRLFVLNVVQLHTVGSLWDALGPKQRGPPSRRRRRERNTRQLIAPRQHSIERKQAGDITRARQQSDGTTRRPPSHRTAVCKRGASLCRKNIGTRGHLGFP